MKTLKLGFALVALVALFAGICNAATYTNVVGSMSGGYNANDARKTFVQEITLDFATRNVVSNDVVQLLNVKDGSLVVAVEVDVVTTNSPANEMRNLSVGDGGSATRYDSDVPMGAVAQTVSAASVWNLYTANDTIDITANDTFTNGSIKVRAFIVDFSR